MDSEDIYALDIHPLIERMTLVCKQYDLPMFCTVQDGDSSFRTTCVNEQLSEWYKIRLMRYLHQTWDVNGFMGLLIRDIREHQQPWDIDGFLHLLIKDAREHGHESKFLKGMGIPEKPYIKEKT